MNEFCYRTANVWQIGGYVLFVLKIVIPLILIILGIIDFTKIVISGETKMAKNATLAFLKRLIAGVAIFFVPTIINLIFSYVDSFKKEENDYLNCIHCLTSPNKDCDTSYEPVIFNSPN